MRWVSEIQVIGYKEQRALTTSYWLSALFWAPWKKPEERFYPSRVWNNTWHRQDATAMLVCWINYQKKKWMIKKMGKIFFFCLLSVWSFFCSSYLHERKNCIRRDRIAKTMIRQFLKSYGSFFLTYYKWRRLKTW